MVLSFLLVGQFNFSSAGGGSSDWLVPSCRRIQVASSSVHQFLASVCERMIIHSPRLVILPSVCERRCERVNADSKKDQKPVQFYLSALQNALW